MNGWQDLCSVIRTIFPDIPPKDEMDDHSPIGNAICRSDVYVELKTNLICRLERLAKVYGPQKQERKTLLTKVQELDSPKNWQGAYAELAVYDCFSSATDFLPRGIRMDVDIRNPKDHYRKEFGAAGPLNLDGCLPEMDVYFDVKALQNITNEILQGVVEESRHDPNILVLPEYDKDMDWDEIRLNRKKIAAELADGIASTNEKGFVRIGVVKGLAFWIVKEPGVAMSESCYNPYRHAQVYHRLVLQHVKKVHRNRPFLLVFVVFPWFNDAIIRTWEHASEFYRAFARRVFCQYKDCSKLATEYLPEYQGKESIGELLKGISGILFVEDICLEKCPKNSTSTRLYAFLSPNARNPVPALFTDYLQSIHQGGTEVAKDDFGYDNY